MQDSVGPFERIADHPGVAEKTAAPRNSRVWPQDGHITATRLLSRYARNVTTLGSRANPPSFVICPSTAPWGTGQTRFRHRHSDRLTRSLQCLPAPTPTPV